MKLKKCKIVNGPMYKRSAPKQYVCFLKGRSFLYKFYTVTICWPKLYIPSALNLSTLAHTVDCVCSKILNHGLNHGLLFSLFKFFGWNNILNSGLKSRFLFRLIFQFYLTYRLIWQKLAHCFLPQWLWWAPFFKCL